MHEHEYRDEYITYSVAVQFGSSFKSGCCLRIPLQPQQHAAIQAVEPASVIYLYYSTKMNTTQIKGSDDIVTLHTASCIYHTHMERYHPRIRPSRWLFDCSPVLAFDAVFL